MLNSAGTGVFSFTIKHTGFGRL